MADMKALYRRYIEEKEAFQKKNGYPPILSEMSEDLQRDIKKDVPLSIQNMGRSDLETYLKAF